MSTRLCVRSSFAARVQPSRRYLLGPKVPRAPRGLGRSQLGSPRCQSSNRSETPVFEVILSPITSMQTHLRVKLGIEGDSIFGQLYRFVLPGPLAFAPSLLMPLSCVLAAYGAVYGPHWLDQLFGIAIGIGFQDELLRSLVRQHWAGSEVLRLLVSVTFASLGALADFIAVPTLDVILGRDLGADDEERQHMLENSAGYRGVLYTFAAIHFAALANSCYVAGTYDLHPLALTGLILSQAAAGGVMLTVVHELTHSRRKADNRLAAALLATVWYMHWSLAHMAHHVNVGKWDDPASARKGESLYRFVPRSVIGHIKDGVGAEMHRLAAKKISVWSPRNSCTTDINLGGNPDYRVWWWAAWPMGIAAAVHAAFGPNASLLFCAQAAGAVFLLEAVNYLEHYSLTRERLPNGRWEKVQAKHSWNANWIATSALTFRLQRHADHHLMASRPYQALQDIDEAPQLPASYPAMAMLALFPGLFFDVMEARLAEYKAAGNAAAASASDEVNSEE